jgi:hypothetical protein
MTVSSAGDVDWVIDGAAGTPAKRAAYLFD